MTDVMLRRTDSAPIFGSKPRPDTNPSLWLSRGIARWPSDSKEKGVEFQRHVQQTASIAPAIIYEAAYERWFRLITETPQISGWAGQLAARLFIGLGSPSVIETAVTLSKTYGVPIIPGSAQKGLAQAFAREVGVSLNDQQILFGKGGESTSEFDSGYVVFHDAWWIPNSTPTPLVPEVVTVHHSEYYETGGVSADATDFDSPTPNVQIAARGSFMFSIECADADWSLYSISLLSHALTKRGIGSKGAAGYGRFLGDDKNNRRLEDTKKNAIIHSLPPKDRLRATVEALSLDSLPTMLGKEKNKTKDYFGPDWSSLLDLIKEIHGEAIRGWEHSDKKNEKKAYKEIFLRP